jgi:hypothetical protein
MGPDWPSGAATVLVLVLVAAAAGGSAGAPPTDVSRGAATPDIQVRQQPDIQVRPQSLLFPNGTDGPATRTLAVRNVGNATLTVGGIDVVGPDRAAFEVAFDGPVALDPGEGRNVTVSLTAADARSRFAMLHVLSDDPDEPQRNVWVTNSRTVADVSPSRVLAEKTLVNATVRNAEANTTQSLNLSWPLTRDDRVAVDALSFTPERDGNVTLSVATNASRFGDVPAFARADGTEPAGFVRVEHTIANEDVRNVTFALRVRRDLLAGNGTGPEDVALYRYGAGTWTELPTRLVGEGDTHFFFEASAPGLSDFATGVKQAKFRITDAVVTVTRIRTDEGTEVLVRVRNVGGADGTYEVELLLDEDVVDHRELSVAPNGTRQATFERSFDTPGSYRIHVNDRFVGNVTVNPAGTATPGTAGGGATVPETGTSPTSRSLPGFDLRTGVAAFVISALLFALRRRR